MQEHNVGLPPAPQLLRESYLAEARAQQRHSDMSRSDASGARRLVYGGLKGSAEDPGCRDEPQGPDLSAFLSQEELDKSVNLACQAIGHKPREEEEKKKVMVVVGEAAAAENATGCAALAAAPPACSAVPTTTFSSASSSTHCTAPPPVSSPSSFSTPPSVSSPSTFSVPPSAPPSSPFSVLTPAAPSVLTFPTPHPSSTSSASPAPLPGPAPGRREPAARPPAHTTFRADARLDGGPALPANGMSHGKPLCEAPAADDPERSGRGPPAYGVENQSKKEFLNKAADFIEELSSLFKANSSKRVRPRSCKTHKSRTQGKGPDGRPLYALGADDRDRPVSAPQPEEEEEVVAEGRPSLGAASYQPVLEAEQPQLPQQDSPAAGEQQTRCDPPSRQVEVEVEVGVEEEQGREQEAERLAPTDTPYSVDPVCEPPCFIQKLKSREVLEGSKVQLDCTVTGRPVPEVRWFCEGKELENSPDIQILTSGERHSLTIAEAFEEDTGRYSCFASNFYGTDSTSAEIYVEGASSTDSEGEPLFEHVTHQVQKVQKKPTNPTHPAPVPSAAARPAASAGADESGGSSQTTITSTSTSVTAGDEPPQPPVGTLREEAPVQPAAPPAPEFSSAAAPQFLREEPAEDPAVDPWRAAALPPEEPEEPQEPALTPLPSPGPGPGLQPQAPGWDAAFTDVNVPESSVHVAPTQTTSVEIQNSIPLSHREQEVRPIMAAPVFTKSLQEVLALEGQLVVLECRMKGVPSPRVEWYREGTVIEDSPDFRILQKKPRSPSESEEICTLVIAEVFPEDSGMFTCTASNKYGTVSSVGALRVKGNSRGSGGGSMHSSAVLEPGQVQESFLSEVTAPAVKHQPEVTVTTSVKPHASSVRLDSLSSSTLRLDPLSSSTLRVEPLSSSTIRLDPLSSSTLRLDPLSSSTLRLDPLSSSILRSDTPSVSLPSLDPRALSGERLSYSGAPRLDPQYLISQRLNPSGSSADVYPKPLNGAPAAEPQTPGFKAAAEQNQAGHRPALPDLAAPEPPKARAAPAVVPLPAAPATSCLKTSALANNREPRSGAKAGLRVHFRLPEDEEEEEEEREPSGWPYEDAGLAANRGPPPVLTKPKLDPAQLQLLHKQVLLEQQQDDDSHPHSKARPQSPPWSQALPQSQSQYQPPPPAQSLTQSQPPPPVQSLTQALPQSQFQYQPPPPAQSLTHSQPAPYTQSLTQAHPQSQPQYQPPPPAQSLSQSQPASDSVVWSPRLHHEPTQQPFQLYQNTAVTTQSHIPVSSLTMAPAMPTLTSSPAPIFHTTPAAQLTAISAPATGRPSPPQLTMAPPARPPQLTATPAVSLYSSAPALTTQTNTIHASHLNLSLAAQSKAMPPGQFSSPTAPQFHATPAAAAAASQGGPPSLQEVTSPAAMLRSTHASLMNLAATSQSFSYARPREFMSPVRSPSPTESPVPLLNELAAELNSSAASSPTIPPFSSPPPRVFPTRVLQSPTSPLSGLSSPTLISAPFLNSVFAGRAQSPPQAPSPASSSSTPSPIQNPVAFLSSVLPSLHLAQATNSMGLPKGAPAGQLKRLPKTRTPSSEDIRVSKEVILNDIERRLRFNSDSSHFGFQQKLNNEGKTASRPLGPNIPATVFNYDEEYKVSNFEQRLMSEIEFRLERTPVEESDDEVHHDEVPTGRCIAPVFDKKLRNFRAMEGVPVTLSCKLVGIPIPKVYWFKDGKQILRKNDHYKKIREGDGTCALHIDYTTNDDDGNYTVMAANPQGRISCSGHLIVQTGASRNRMTPIHSQRVRTRIQEVEEGEPTQERFFRPHFLQAPGDMVAHEGRLCRLDCKVSGLPNPELMWLVNGKPIYPDIFHRMLVRENGVHSLVIDPVVQNHAEKEVKQPPCFVEKLQNTGIPEGNPARLECRVSGMPPPAIFWKKDNDTVPRTKDRFSMHQDATGYVCLLIQPTRKDDAGWYTVSAKNEAGIVSCTSRLDIYAQWHQGIPTPMKVPFTGSRYAALTGQGLDLKSVFPSSNSGPILFASSPLESKLESEEL